MFQLNATSMLMLTFKVDMHATICVERMIKMEGIICLGEALVDMIPTSAQNDTYYKAAGGAPANVSVGIAKLGGKATFIGKVGDDVLGHFLCDTLTDYGVSPAMQFSANARTGLTFVALSQSGERDFHFYIEKSADQQLTSEEIDEALVAQHHMLHFGSISLIHEPAKEATLRAIQIAKQHRLIVSYDPNVRLRLWQSAEHAKNVISATLPYADIVKLSDEELLFLTDCDTLEDGIAQLRNIPLLLITLGERGCMYRFNGHVATVEGISVKAIDTTGAGDAFMSSVLYHIEESEKTLTELSIEEVEHIVKRANISGALATTKKGAMTGLPTLDEVEALANKIY